LQASCQGNMLQLQSAAGSCIIFNIWSFSFWVLRIEFCFKPRAAYSIQLLSSSIIYNFSFVESLWNYDAWYDMIWFDMMWLYDRYMIYDIWYMIYDIWYDMIPYDMIDSSHRFPHLLILFWFSEVRSNFWVSLSRTFICLAAWLIRPSLMRYEPLCRCRISAASCCPTAILE
jgi:hypothetical protein